MRPFAYSRPNDVAGAIALASQPGTKFLGGGTNLVDLMKMGVEHPDHLVAIGRLPLTGIEEKADGSRRSRTPPWMRLPSASPAPPSLPVEVLVNRPRRKAHRKLIVRKPERAQMPRQTNAD